MYQPLVRTLVLGLFTLSAVFVQAEEADNKFEAEKQLPLAELRRFSEVFDRIKQAYVEPVSDSQLLEDAVRGMLSGLDPHSSYLGPEDFSELQVQTSGQFGGVGIEVSQEDGLIRVITPIDDTPAVRAGIKPGDLIIKIDGQTVQSIGLDQAIAMMRGKPGTEIILTVIRDENDVPLDISVLRDIIRVTSVKERRLSSDIAYIRITQFQRNTAKDLRKSLKKLQQDKPLSGLVLDLRNNPGGVLRGAVEVTDAFIDSGVIVSTKGRLANSQTTYGATSEMAISDIPIVVLINGGSASASEIVAGALQDTKRAVIMGTSSFGKGSVQTVLQLSDERAIKLTTARYFTPNGRSIQAKGIVPDIAVNEAKVKSIQSDNGLKEKDLNGHLSNGDDIGSFNGTNRLAEQDFQLYQAVNLLKGLAIVRNSH